MSTKGLFAVMISHENENENSVMREELNRMRWAARRGMLELDLVLEPFVTVHYPTLSLKHRSGFKKLMEEQDQDLFSWLLQRGQPVDSELQTIVRLILEFTQSRSASPSV